MLQRRGTETEWYDVRNTAILQPGEIGLETDTGRFKVGNGINVWIDLPYYLPDNNPKNNSLRTNKNNADIYSKLIATQTFVGNQTLTSGNASQIPLLIAGKESQSAALQRWSNSSDQTLASMSSAGKLTATGAQFNSTVDLNGNAIINVKNIDVNSTDGHAVNKKYVDEAIAGLLWKDPVNLVSVATGTDLFDWIDVPLEGLTGTVILDGHPALTSSHGNGYRLLLLNQTVEENNGIWVYTDDGTGYVLNRPADADTFEELRGASIFVQEGTLYGTSSFVQTNHYLSSYDDQEWVQFNGASQITAGAGLKKSGNVLFTTAGDGIQINDDSIQVAEDGIVSSMIANNTIINENINPDADIEPTKILGDAVTKADTGTVTSLMILNNTIVNADINEEANIEPEKILGVAVTQDDVGTVTSTMILNGTILENDISNGAITSAKIASETIVDADISPTAGINTSKIADFKLDKLTDVTITDPVENKQILRYNGLQWINETPSGGISISPTPPEAAVGGDAWFDSTDGSLYVYYDDGSGQQRTNYIGNPSFEVDTSGWSSISGGTLARVTSQSYSRTASAQLIATAQDQGLAAYLSGLSGLDLISATFTASAWVKGEAGKEISISVLELSFMLGEIARSTQTITATGSWQRIDITRSFSDSARNARVLIENKTSGAHTFYTDAVLLEASSTLGTYFDGATAGASWTFDADASFSTITSTTVGSAQWVQVKANSALEASILTRMSAVEAQLVQNSNNQYSVNATKYASYILTAEDQNSFIPFDTASAGGSVTVSIPTDATYNFDIGTKIDIGFINGINKLLISAQTPGTTTIHNKLASLQSVSVVAYGMATLVKVAANKWMITGDIASPTP
jgi:hypothetical protein